MKKEKYKKGIKIIKDGKQVRLFLYKAKGA